MNISKLVNKSATTMDSVVITSTEVGHHTDK